MTPRRFSPLFPIYRFRSALLPYKQPEHFPPLVQSKPYLPVTFGDHHSPKSNDLISLSTQSKLHLTHTEEADSIPPTNYNKLDVVKKHSNLITANAPLLPVKLRNGGEGNFVKLNMNRKRKFLNKRGGKKRSSYASAGYRSYRRNKRSVKRVKEGEGGSNCEEDGELVVEATQKEARKSGEVVEEVVMAVRNEASDENLVRLLNAVYGYDSFGDGQLEAIKMVLDGKSTMLVLPTGAGKSLCYQIPAMVLEGITLVVSPLVALMIDQLKQLPWVTQGRLLCSSQTPEEVAEILRLLQEGAIKVLFVSPERFSNAEFMSTFSVKLPISLLVVDEAHCVSEWNLFGSCHIVYISYMDIGRAAVLEIVSQQDGMMDESNSWIGGCRIWFLHFIKCRDKGFLFA